MMATRKTPLSNGGAMPLHCQVCLHPMHLTSNCFVVRDDELIRKVVCPICIAEGEFEIIEEVRPIASYAK